MTENNQVVPYLKSPLWVPAVTQLQGAELTVFEIIYSFSKEHSKTSFCDVSISYFMRATNKSKRAIIYAIRSLQKKRMIKVDKTKGDNNKYSISESYKNHLNLIADNALKIIEENKGKKVKEKKKVLISEIEAKDIKGEIKKPVKKVNPEEFKNEGSKFGL